MKPKKASAEKTDLKRSAMYNIAKVIRTTRSIERIEGDEESRKTLRPLRSSFEFLLFRLFNSAKIYSRRDLAVSI